MLRRLHQVTCPGEEMLVAVVQYQAPDQRKFHQLTLRPSKIEVGDWMRDLGRYRQVKSIEALEDPVTPSTVYSVCFADDADGDYPTLGVPEAVPVTVWREA